MGHYKANLRDLEFTLFEVLGRDTDPRHRPVRRRGRRHGAQHPRRGPQDRGGPARRLVRGRRPQSADLRPRDPQRDAARVVQGVVPGIRRRRVGPARRRRRPRRPGPAVLGGLGGLRDGDRRQPRHSHVRLRCGVRPDPAPAGHRRAAAVRRADARPRLGLDHGPHRAGRRVRRRRRAHQGDRAAGRQLAPRGRQAVHHQRRLGRPGEHRAPGAGPTRGCPAGYQGTLAVRRPQVPRRPRDRRARRTQRRLRHQRREEDGSEGVEHLRAHLRRQRRTCRGVAGRGHPRRHRPDVRGHRDGPDDGRDQGDRHPVDRLPQRSRVRQDPGAGRGPHPDDATRPRPGSPSPTIRTSGAR